MASMSETVLTTLSEELSQTFDELVCVEDALSAVEELLSEGATPITGHRLACLIHPHIEQIGMALATLKLAKSRLPDIRIS